MPIADFFDGIPMSAALNMSAADLELWHLLQPDTVLAEAARMIRRFDAEGDYPSAYIHADLRLDQYIVAGDSVMLSDFEEVRLGDPARDLGSLVGDVVFQALITIPRRLGGESLKVETNHEAILTAGSEALDDVLPDVKQAVEGYRSIAGSLDQALVERAVCYAGWHMFDRMLASAEGTHRVDGILKAIAGIGRNLITAPGTFSGMFFPHMEEAA